MKAENDRRDFQEETTELKDLIEANTDKTILERIRMLNLPKSRSRYHSRAPAMPTRQLIEKEINKSVRVGPDFDKIRRKYLRLLADFTKRDTIIYASGFLSKTAQGIPNTFILITHVDVQGFMTALQGMKGDKLDLGVLSVYHATNITLENTNCVKFVENHQGKGWFYKVKVN